MSNLFLATGGSGHAFKFLPVLGEKISDAIEGNLPGYLKDKWSFRDVFFRDVVTKDGSRSGVERQELVDLLRSSDDVREKSKL